ncbi:MAG TPA: hybrid sensor histidine kinase/response regulator, partial [Kofleriaceae bacterium]|nr:hybrid sensor histidine kinase/response regulator [Kofleriaceae bacterium]
LGRRHLERLDRISTSGQHLLRLVEDVLDLAKMDAGRIQVSREPVDVTELVRELRSTLAPMVTARGITLTVAPVSPGVAMTVMADRTRISQVLMNFGSNAIKYGRDGGHITLQIERSGDRVRVAVRDDGIGIPADMQARIFEPFHRAGQEAGSIEGTGIGLTISKRLVEMMGGSIGFSSEVGRGSIFWIELPEVRGAQDPVVHAAPTVTVSPLASEGPRDLIVYVEDNPSNIALMEALIDDLPRVEVVTANTAELGIELIRARKPKVVIMDVNLPGMSGIEATRRLAEWPETRDIPVIGLSAAALPADTERARASGFYRYLTKPVKIDELTTVLEQILLSRNSCGQPG